MTIRRILRSAALAVALAAAGISAWQGWQWLHNAHQNERIRKVLAHADVRITPEAPLAVLFARGYGEGELERYREARSAYQTIWIRTDGGRRGDPRDYAVRARYNLANLYLRRATERARNGEVDGARTMAELAKEAYRDALRARPAYWAAKRNFEAAQRLVRDLPNSQGTPEEGAEPKEDVWSQMPGFPRGEP
ncbi:hypothetical protein [Thiohalorhabdus methylotrophus]|uniref:MxaK protein n=1 Tax=Thiohalorhabdus methylotrophus TaxID=3242694 RepID=A0ABV4U194_9GAMM